MSWLTMLHLIQHSMPALKIIVESLFCFPLFTRFFFVYLFLCLFLSFGGGRNGGSHVSEGEEEFGVLTAALILFEGTQIFKTTTSIK